MRTRPILKLAFAVVFIAGLNWSAHPVRAADAAAGGPQYYELRVYTTKTEHQQKLVDDYWRAAAIPAYNRLGIRPVGVFTELADSPTNKIYVLIPYDSFDLIASVPTHLAADAEYQSAGAEYLNASKFDPAYVRFESSLSVAFAGQKKLEVPQSPAENKPWVFELRTYESPGEGKGNNKVLMFNSGEIPLMHDVGLSPVFFGQALMGDQMPNLVYMVSGESMEAHKAHWKAFFEAPTWKTLSGDPKYKDNVSKVINVFLKRTPASQI